MRFYTKDFTQILTKSIRNARHSIYISLYRLKDPTLLQALVSAQKRGVAVTIHTDPGSKPLHALPWKHYHGSGLMHEKLFIIDTQTTFIGSANGTEDSLLVHKNFLCGFHSAPLAKALLANTPQITLPIGDYTLNLWRLPQKDHNLIERIATLLTTSKQSADISLFTLTHPRLIEAITQSQNPKVRLDATSWKAIQACRDAGIDVKTPRPYPLEHRKNALIDDTHLIFGSANWTKSAFTKNQEIFAILTKTN